MPPELAVRTDTGEFSPRETFLRQYSDFVGFLSGSEKVVDLSDSRVNGAYFSYCRALIEPLRKPVPDVREAFSPEEIDIFERTLYLFCMKNSLPPFDVVPEANQFIKGEGLQEMTVELAGPIAVGKSTIARSLAKDIGAYEAKEGYLPEDNPFLKPSYENPGLMLRTQLRFLLDNIISGLGSKYQEGRWDRETSVWSDIYVFMEWRRRMGYVTPEEHGAYMNTVSLLEPLIEKPDLLVMLIPDSLENLRRGLDIRIEAEPEEREMEKQITDEDLACVIESSRSAVEILREKKIKVMVIDNIDPVELHERPELQYSSIYAIRGELGILNEYLEVDPESAAKKIVGIFAPSKPPQVVVVHSESMFAGKTSTLNRVAEMVGKDRVVAFQPDAAIRYGEEHRTNMIDRDRGKIPATTILSNKLEDILGFLDNEGITAKDKPLVFIDEVMLFNGSDKDEAIAVIEELRKRGFQVVVNGIDWTFQELPFTFMQDLLERAITNEDWSEVRLGTKCRYCESPARGSRRYTRTGDIADFNDVAFQAGENYEPVCCKNGHISCLNQPEGFVRQPLPTKANQK